jgi:hypothetical protein
MQTMTYNQAWHVAREPHLYSDSDCFRAVKTLTAAKAPYWVIRSLNAWLACCRAA